MARGALSQRTFRVNTYLNNRARLHLALLRSSLKKYIDHPAQLPARNHIIECALHRLAKDSCSNKIAVANELLKYSKNYERENGRRPRRLRASYYG